ncbi:antibiotic biosynthesis monooxygenase, partial [Escherichia coli]|nr:antibiotic biosynthesis monooxygenase [Escherichia coli]
MTEQIAFILKAKTRPEMADAFENLFRPYVEPS